MAQAEKKSVSKIQAKQDKALPDQKEPAPQANLTAFVRKYKISQKEGFSDEKAVEGKATNARGTTLDTHELLKKEMFGSSNAGSDNHFEKNRPSPDGVIGVSDHYIILDSFEKLPSSDIERGIFQWNFMVQGVTRDQTIGVRDKVETIIEIQLGNFAIPQLPLNPYTTNDGTDTNLPILVPNLADPGGGSLDSQLTQLPFGSFATVQLKEIGNQKISDIGGGHHFGLMTSANLPGGLVSGYDLLGNPIPAKSLFFTPVPGWDTFVFTDPIKDVHGLTLQFKTPDIPVRFPRDVFYTPIAQVDIVASQWLEFAVEGHGLVENDRIFVTGFNSTDAILNKYMNNENGLLVGSDAFNTPDTFLLNPNVDVSAFGVGGTEIHSTTPITIFIARRRMRIPLRLRGVVGRLTQYVSP